MTVIRRVVYGADEQGEFPQRKPLTFAQEQFIAEVDQFIEDIISDGEGVDIAAENLARYCTLGWAEITRVCEGETHWDVTMRGDEAIRSSVVIGWR